MLSRKMVLEQRPTRFVSVYDVGQHANDAYTFLRAVAVGRSSSKTPNEFRSDLVMSADALDGLCDCNRNLIPSDLQTPFLVSTYLAIALPGRMPFRTIATNKDAGVVADRFFEFSSYLKDPHSVDQNVFNELRDFTKAVYLQSQKWQPQTQQSRTGIDSILSAFPKD